jgi:hypothetical protein
MHNPLTLGAFKVSIWNEEFCITVYTSGSSGSSRAEGIMAHSELNEAFPEYIPLLTSFSNTYSMHLMARNFILYLEIL